MLDYKQFKIMLELYSKLGIDLNKTGGISTGVVDPSGIPKVLSEVNKVW